MKRTIGESFATIVFLSVVSLFPSTLRAQQATPANSTSTQTPASKIADQTPPVDEGQPSGEVVIDARGPIVTVYETVTGRTPQQRADAIAGRIISIANDPVAAAEPIRLEPHQGWTELISGNQIIMAVTEGDANTAGKPRQKLAEEYAQNISHAIQTYRQEHGWRAILRGILYTALTTLIAISVLWILRWIRFGIRDRLEKHIKTSAAAEKKNAWNIAMAYVGPISLALGGICRWILILAILEAYLTITLGFFSTTRQVSLTVTKWVFAQLESMGQTALDYVPNLVVVAVIVLVTYYLSRLLRLVFGEIEKGELKVRGFYPDWAKPTENLIRLLLVVLALIVCFPYLPGAKSPAFQGISIFLGLLLSLGSSSAVANAIAGVILTYMRSFLVGDWVEINGTTGEVVEKNLLVTRVLTPKDEVITIPNATVMSGAVRNYSVEARKSGVIFHTTATIGYDAPWRTVHELLISAAIATPHVLKQPAPFVLQSALNDFYVSYELNAYTDVPKEMLNIYSALHQNIQDKFNEAGVEICSPHFSALRDGNTIAIPGEYIKPDYEPPGFRINGSRAEKDAESSAKKLGDSRRIG